MYASGYHWGPAMRVLIHLFMLPGDVACDLLGAREADDRMMIRTLVNMLVWNFVVVVGAVLVWHWGWV